MSRAMNAFWTIQQGVYEEGYVKLGSAAFLDFASMIKAAPALMKYQAWRSVYSIVSSYVQDEKLRQALSFHTLLVGGNPMNTTSIYALIHTIEKDGGVWFARGGTNRLVAGMVALFERLGGMLRLNDPVERITTTGDRVTGVVTKSGWQGTADAVASNGDMMHNYAALLKDHPRGAKGGESVETQTLVTIFVRRAFRREGHIIPTSRTTASCLARAIKACSTTSIKPGQCQTISRCICTIRP